MGLLASLLLASACGRIGFDPISQLDDGGTAIDAATPIEDGAVDPDLLVRITFDDDPNLGAADQQGLLQAGLCTPPRCPVSAPGIIGSSYQFDGVDDYVQFATVAALDFGKQSQPFSVSLWYRAADLTPPVQQVLMAQSEGSGSVSYQLSFEPVQDSGALDLIWKVCEGGCQSGLFGVAPDLANLETWIFVVGTWDGSITRLFVDAVEIASVPKATIAFDGSPFMVGADFEAGNSIEDTFNGAIDDLRIYGRALSQAEQMQLLQEAKP